MSETQTNKTFEKDPKELGALWLRKSSKGNDYFSGTLELDGQKIEIVVFSANKKSERQPDWRIYRSEPPGEAGVAPVATNQVAANKPTPATAAKKPVAKPTPKPAVVQESDTPDGFDS